MIVPKSKFFSVEIVSVIICIEPTNVYYLNWFELFTLSRLSQRKKKGITVEYPSIVSNICKVFLVPIFPSQII